MKKFLKVAAITVFLAYTARADYDVTFTHGGSYFTVESGDIDPGLAFGHGFLAPGSGAGAAAPEDGQACGHPPTPSNAW